MATITPAGVVIIIKKAVLVKFGGQQSFSEVKLKLLINILMTHPLALEKMIY